MLSVVIPSRNEPYLKKTIEDILNKATGEIEVTAVLDGYWIPLEMTVDDPRVNYIHYPSPLGMRRSINDGVAISIGEYILKSDAHCMFDKGFDEKLIRDHQPNWVTIPRRYALDVKTWEIEKRTDNKYPIDEMILDENNQGRPTKKRIDNAIFPTESAQGSCYMIRKDYYTHLKLLDEDTFTSFWNEFQEIGFKVELDGGKVMRNTKTFYCHWHKPETRGYSLQGVDREKAQKEIRKLYEQVLKKRNEKN